MFATTIVVDPNPPVIANSITSSVTGADMTGLIVVASYKECCLPLTLNGVWEPTGPTSGTASGIYPPLQFLGPAFTLSVTGNASGTLAWQYTTILLGPLMSLTLDGSAAGIYFDRAHSGPGTPGTGPGADISFGPLFAYNNILDFVVVTYSGAVSLDGKAPQNDLYAKMTISFAGDPMFGGLGPQDFAFTQPVDRNIAPEPISVVFILTGLGALSVDWKRIQSDPPLPRDASE